MKQFLLCLIVISIVTFFATDFAYAQYTSTLNDKIFVFVQTTLRNSDGQLITYLESNKFTHLNLQEINSLLDFETSSGTDPIITIAGKDYQLIRRERTLTFDSNNVIGTTSLSANIDGKTKLLALFAHDGYPVVAGDELTSIWTFLRLVT